MRAACQNAKGPGILQAELQPHSVSLSRAGICPWLEGGAITVDTVDTGREEEAQKDS